MEPTTLITILPTVVDACNKLIVGACDNLFDRSIEKLVMNKADFESIIEDRILFEELPDIDPQLIHSFLELDDVELIVKQIYVDNLVDKTLEEIKEDFCSLFSHHFGVITEPSYEFASNLFDVLVEGCHITFDKAISRNNLAAHDAKTQYRFRQLSDGLGRIERNTQDTADFIHQFQNVSPLLVPGHSVKKLLTILDHLDIETKSNPDFDIEHTNTNGKHEVKLTPKNNNIGIDIKFKPSYEKSNNGKDIKELINSELKKGNSIIFTEEEIEHFSIKNPQFEDIEVPSQIEFIPTASGKPLNLTFLIEGTDLAYHDVEMGSIYRNGDEGTLMSQNLPFKFILNMQKDTTSMNLDFKLNCTDLSILDLNKVLQFISALNRGEKLLCRDSKRGTLFFSSNNCFNFELEQGFVEFVKRLAEIDIAFHVDFMYPEVVTTADLMLIDDLISLINYRYINVKIKNLKIPLKIGDLDEILKSYENNGCLVNFKCTSPIVANLFGKKIYFGEGTTSMSKSKIQENIELLREKSKTNDEVKITLIPLEFDGKIHFE